MPLKKRKIYIDPSYTAYYHDRLFDTTDPFLNRDGTLLPFARLRSFMNSQGVEVKTADYLLNQYSSKVTVDYYSLGVLKNYRGFIGNQSIRLRGFLIMEPPVVAPKLYRALPDLTKHFDQVYVHNTIGDGYSLKGVNQERLRKFYWPQPYAKVIEPYWSNTTRNNRIVVINGNHIPRVLKNQLYGKRIEVMAGLAKVDAVDLYGRGWDKWWSYRSMWPPYWKNYKTLMSIYRGSCASKYEILGGYKFSLCFENMSMQGYVTEKIFDCFYAGCIPIYFGAKDIRNLLPSNSYIDYREFSSPQELNEKLMGMSDAEAFSIRSAGRKFIEDEHFQVYYQSMVNIFND